MSTISSGSSGLTWTSDNSSNLAITLTSIVDNTGNTVPSTTLVKGSAKAWVNFNGIGTVTIRSSFNVSSITDNGTGNYTINFTTAMPNANYAATSGGGGSIRNNTLTNIAFPESLYAAGSLGVDTQYANMTAFDAPIVSVSVFSS